MGMNRQQVFYLINAEREYQSRNYNPDETTSSGQTRRERDKDVAPGVLMLNAYTHKAAQIWVSTGGDNLATLQQVAKIAAIAVRILEQAGGSELLLEKGLR